MSAKADISGKVNLLLNGAADYVTKPFDTRELLARMTAVLRSNARSNGAKPLVFEDIILDTVSRSVCAGGVLVRLTKTEYAILKLLMQNPSQVIAKSVMLERISSDTPDCVESSLKVHISNLRKKLRDVTGRDYIEAVWGIGFKMRESGS